MTEHVIPIMASCFLLAVSAQEPAPVRDERCKSALVTADLEEITGSVKPMNAVNNGPVKSNRGTGNLELWKELKIPFARNHDASFHAVYGGEHVVDVHAIFRDFSKDPYDPASYDFTLTDEYLATIQEGGTKVFYRLGSTIEHAKKNTELVFLPISKNGLSFVNISSVIIQRAGPMAIDGISSIGKSGTNPTSAAEKPTKKPGRELMNSFCILSDCCASPEKAVSETENRRPFACR